MTTVTMACHDVSKRFDNQVVLDAIRFTVAPGHILALLGPSGCGKTTLLRLIAGFERLDAGEIEIDGRIVAAPGRHMPPERRRVGMVFQDYAIFPHLSVADNVGFGLRRGNAADERTRAMLAFVGLADAADRMPHELSGGQQQRVALARALAPAPAILLLDEPFSNLDGNLRTQVRHEVRQLLRESDATAVFVTHDQEEALFLGDRVGIMNAGRLEQVGTPEQLFHRPQTRFVAEFLGPTDFIDGETTATGVASPLGMLPQRLSLPPGQAVAIALRPDDVQLLPDDDGNGRIVDSQFMGIARLYAVALSDGTVVHSWQPHTLDLAAGTAVAVQFRPGHTLCCFVDGRLVAAAG